MSRRKYVTLQALQQEMGPPGEGESIVKAVGSRGSNIMEVEFPDGRRTLCLIPAKFHKKLWIKNGNFLVVEAVEGVDAAVTGQIVQVLYAEHVKQLQRMPGVWPEEFKARGTGTDSGPAGEEPLPDSASSSDGNGSSDGDDDGLPLLEKINNRRVIEYPVSSDSDSD